MGKREVDKALKQLGYTDELCKAQKRSTESERAFLMRASELGYTDFLHSGWPDFMVRDKFGHLVFVEVKSGPMDKLRKNQVRCCKLLEELGIDVYVWIPQRTALTHWRSHQKRKRKPKAKRRQLVGVQRWNRGY